MHRYRSIATQLRHISIQTSMAPFQRKADPQSHILKSAINRRPKRIDNVQARHRSEDIINKKPLKMRQKSLYAHAFIISQFPSNGLKYTRMQQQLKAKSRVR